VAVEDIACVSILTVYYAPSWTILASYCNGLTFEAHVRIAFTPVYAVTDSHSTSVGNSIDRALDSGKVLWDKNVRGDM
jgi:hypothetical protein